MPLPMTPRGNLVYDPDGEVLREFFWDRSRVSVIQGPIGSGTSSACCHKMFRISQEQKPDMDNVRRTHWLVGRESYPQLEKTTVKTWLEWFPEAEYGEFRWSKPMTHTVVKPHPDGKTKVEMMLTFMALSDPEQAISDLASLEITGAFLNEMQFQEKAVLDEVLSRCSRYPSMKNGPGATWFGVIGDLNAPKEGHWIPYMRGDVPFPEDWDDEMRFEYEKPEDWKFFLQPAGLIEAVVDGKVVYQPNPKAENQRWLAEPYIQKIKGKSREWINERVMNRVGLYRAGKPVYPTFLEGEHVLERDMDPVAGFTIICGLDFGRDPAAVFAQPINGQWHVLSEVIGNNESAQLFAPRVKRHIGQMFPGYEIEFYGDPRGADGGQNVEVTAYDIFQNHGMRVYPATTDNNPELRRSAMEAILARRNGLKVNPGVTTVKTGLAGGYHYPKIKGTGMFREKPAKDRYSHPVEALENAILGGGEGRAVVQGPSSMRSRPSKVYKHRLRLRRAAH